MQKMWSLLDLDQLLKPKIIGSLYNNFHGLCIKKLKIDSEGLWILDSINFCDPTNLPEIATGEAGFSCSHTWHVEHEASGQQRERIQLRNCGYSGCFDNFDHQ